MKLFILMTFQTLCVIICTNYFVTAGRASQMSAQEVRAQTNLNRPMYSSFQLFWNFDFKNTDFSIFKTLVNYRIGSASFLDKANSRIPVPSLLISLTGNVIKGNTQWWAYFRETAPLVGLVAECVFDAENK